ncbi:hypothetical protein H4219_002474 [Mycoemilia scoparia]|uniref:Uncharacterized protein n=1 Tax=Mycoemilia scoparia TaxID=417184 RepID=A0A9W8A2G1_9FUNG|nr:hypothetical protein H4219_002474 [Mycoemilia scoparia]
MSEASETATTLSLPIAMGVISGLAILIIVIHFLVKRYKRKNGNQESDNGSSGNNKPDDSTDSLELAERGEHRTNSESTQGTYKGWFGRSST